MPLKIRVKRETKESEAIKIKPDGRISGTFSMYMIEDGDYFICLVPSFNLSGYGKTEDEAKKELSFELQNMFEDVDTLSLAEKIDFFRQLGWVSDKQFKRRLSKSYINDEGALEGFDIPEDAKVSLVTESI